MALLYERDTPLSRRASAVLRKEYLGDGPIQNPKSLQGLGRIYSDALIGVEYHRFMRLMAAHTPIYTYLFRYKGRYSFFKNPDTNQTMGIHHKGRASLEQILKFVWFQVPYITMSFYICFMFRS